VELPAGDFSFGRAPFVVRGAVNMRVKGQGPTATGKSRTSLWFDPGFGVEVLSCVNATVEGFSMDTIAPPFSQAKLIAFDLGLGTPRPTTALVEIEPGFPMPTPTSSPLFNESCPDGSEGVCGEVKMIYWDPTSRHMVQGQQMNSAITTAKTVCNNVVANAGGGRLCNVTIGQPNLDWTPPPGSLITFSPRVAAGKYPIPTYYKGTLAVLNCSRTLLQHIDTFSAGDMTRLECLGYGRNTYRDVNIRRRAEPPYPARLLASNSDGFHTFSVEHGPVVENCELSYIADDFFNAHNRLLPMASLDLRSHTAMIVDVGDVLGHGYVAGAAKSIDAHRIVHTMDSVRKGDVLRFYDDGPAKAFLGSVVVAEAKSMVGAPIPSGWSKTPWKSRVHPDALMLWQVTFGDCTPPPTPPAHAAETASRDVRDGAARRSSACGEVGAFTALVQIDRLSSFGAVIRNS
jgi:hypothetical protein